MKSLIIFLVVLIGGFVWLKDWATSGKMDVYIEEHPDPKITPLVLQGLGELYFTMQEYKPAAHYYKRMIEKYPKHPKTDRMRWQLGRSYEEIGKRSEALEQYTILKDSYSATQYGQMGHNRYGQIKY